MKRHTLLSLLLALALGAAACGEDKKNQTDQEPPVANNDPGDAPFATSTTAQLLWKRQGAVAKDLQRALELSPDELCSELGAAPCADVHQVPLGGNDPFILGLYEPPHEPLSTTPAVLERLVLGACVSAAERDAQGDAKVFTELDLGSDKLDPAGEDKAAVEAQIEDLYRRLLSRDALAVEVSAVSKLATDEGGDGVSALDFAKLSCFAIGSTTEFFFY